MVVKCPNCGTTYNLDESKVSPDGTWVRCSNCENVFQTFPDGQRGGDLPDINIDLGGGGGGGRKTAEDDLDLDLTADLSGKSGGRGKLFKILFWLFGIIILLAALGLGGLVAMDRLGMGGQILETVRNLPLVSGLFSPSAPGSEKQAEEPGSAFMALSQVRGFFRINDELGRIFVIQGMVENQSPVVRSEILVQGRLHDAKGNVLRQAVVYAGPAFTPEELRRMSLAQIQARLASAVGPDGSKYIAVPSGSLPFMIVFADLPGNVTEFTAEVVSTGGGAPPAEKTTKW